MVGDTEIVVTAAGEGGEAVDEPLVSFRLGMTPGTGESVLDEHLRRAGWTRTGAWHLRPFGLVCTVVRTGVAERRVTVEVDASADRGERRPRRDGCYACRSEDGVWAYLKFGPGDLVTSISSHLPPAVFAPHVLPGSDVFSYGSLMEADGQLSVTTVNDEGAVTFFISVLDDGGLWVRSRSHINGYEGSDRYEHVPLP